MLMNPAIIRFYTLDSLRGMAALLIALFHYIRHFLNGSISPDSWLHVLYVHGWRMVDLFFCLSGFIFFWKYSNAIYEKSIRFKKFIYLRFSRVYPLHFVTLIIVGACQFFIYQLDGEYFITSHQDLKHFLLNILFISSWGFEIGYSFNGPIWSVSIEVLLYLIFFLCCYRLKPKNPFWPLFLIAFGGLLFGANSHFIIFNAELGRGLYSFFAGGIAYQVFRIATSSNPKVYFGIVALAGSTALAFWMSLRPLYLHYDFLFSEMLFLIGFPSIVLLLAFLDAKKILEYVFKKLAYLGDISYGVYLIHFPVQLFFFLASRKVQIDYAKPGTALLYLAITIGLAMISHKFYEVPCQRYLRSKLPEK